MNGPQSNAKPSPQALLQENVSQFFSSFYGRYANLMQCGSGCCRCCYTNISIGLGEAAEIIRWFSSLDHNEKELIINKWRTTEPLTGTDAAGHLNTACAFLSSSLCTIYPARPVICRSQGAVLLIAASDDNNNNTEDSAIVCDVCPLNFPEEATLPPHQEWLNLGRLNTLLSIAEQAVANDPIVEYLKSVADSNDNSIISGRISLATLRNAITNLSHIF